MITRELAWPTNLVLFITESSHDLRLTWFSKRELARPTTQVISHVISKQRARVTFDFSRFPDRERAWAATYANTRELAWPPTRAISGRELAWSAACVIYKQRAPLTYNSDNEIAWPITLLSRREREGVGKLTQALAAHGFHILRNKY